MPGRTGEPPLSGCGEQGPGSCYAQVWMQLTQSVP